MHALALFAIAFGHSALGHLCAVSLLPFIGMALGAVVQTSGGNANIGSLTIAAGNNPFLLDRCPDGVIDTVLMTVSWSMESTAGVGPLVVGGLPQGVDDVDLLGNALFAAFSARIDPSTFLYQNVTFPQLRKTIQSLLRRDLSGTMRNGGVVSGAYTTFYMQIPIPIGIPNRFVSGYAFSQGATRMRTGQFDTNIQSGAASGTLSVQLNNYTVNVQSLAVQFSTQGHPGDNGQIGEVWKVEWLNWAQNMLTRPAYTRILFALNQPSATSATSYGDTGITLSGQESYNLVGANETQLRYQNEVLQQGGYDITDGLTPLIMLDPQTTADTLSPPLPLALNVPLATQLNFMDLYVQSASASVAQTSAIAAAGGANQPVAASTVSVPGVAPGSAPTVPGRANLPVVFQNPAKAAPGAALHASATAGATKVVATRSVLRSALSKLKGG